MNLKGVQFVAPGWALAEAASNLSVLAERAVSPGRLLVEYVAGRLSP